MNGAAVDVGGGSARSATGAARPGRRAALRRSRTGTAGSVTGSRHHAHRRPRRHARRNPDPDRLRGGLGHGRGRPATARHPPPPRRLRRRPSRYTAPPPPPSILPPPPNVKVKIGKSGYVFPVYGPASFGNTFQAARADTGWHHGEDIFAPYGAPILAVATARCSRSAGTTSAATGSGSRTPGQPVLLRPPGRLLAARRQRRPGEGGRRVGFVGNTGDAETTPPHLHFEIHPAELLDQGYDGVVAPYP